MRTRSVAVALALGTTVLAMAGAAACAPSSASTGIASAGGSGTATAHPSPTVDAEEQAREFAQCMREHGVDIPDPDTAGGGGVRITVSGNPGGTQAALQACQDKLPNGGTPPSMDPEQQEKLREYAQCMREHGVDIPDPDPNGGGLMITKSGGPGDGPNLDPNDPSFQAAQQACQDKLPGALQMKGGPATDSGDGKGPGQSVGGGSTGGGQ